jgi:hypothetical protein
VGYLPSYKRVYNNITNMDSFTICMAIKLMKKKC